MKLRNKTAIVTGAGAGIGQAIATLFASEGASVLCASLHEEKCKATALSIANNGEEASFFALDVGCKKEVGKLVSKCLTDFGKIDILVNSAGGLIGGPKRFMELTEEDLDANLSANLKGIFFCSQAVAREMMKSGKGGKIVNIDSMWGTTATSMTAHYSASKGGVRMLTKAMGLALISSGINVNSIAPGLTLTPFIRDEQKHQPEWVALQIAQIPIGRMAEPEEMAQVAIFLASSSSDYMVGETITVDGGWSICSMIV
ncbi:SDR family NAD(P)-dependent oxidoreductase [Chloroflexota bacterium]